MKRTKNAFTLIELLVVIAIVGVLMALIAPAIASTREKATIVNCMNNLKNISMAAFMYADDHNEVIPDIVSVDTNPETPNQLNLLTYVDNDSIYECPRDTRSAEDIATAKTSYTAWQYTPDVLLPSKYTRPQESVPGGNDLLLSETVLYLESDKAGVKARTVITKDDVVYRHDNRTVVVFADGHVFSCNEEQISAMVLSGSKDRF